MREKRLCALVLGCWVAVYPNMGFSADKINNSGIIKEIRNDEFSSYNPAIFNAGNINNITETVFRNNNTGVSNYMDNRLNIKDMRYWDDWSNGKYYVMYKYGLEAGEAIIYLISNSEFSDNYIAIENYGKKAQIGNIEYNQFNNNIIAINNVISPSSELATFANTSHFAKISNISNNVFNSNSVAIKNDSWIEKIKGNEFNNNTNGAIVNIAVNTTLFSITDTGFIIPNISNGSKMIGGGISSIEGNTFSYNSSAQGGAIYNSGTIDSIEGSEFSYNSATGEYDSGGAIYNYRGTIGSITDTDFSNNSAGYSGGAIWNGDGASIGSITNTEFSYNSATNGVGGAIWNVGGTIGSITDTDFSYNSARDGGAIWNVGGTIGSITDTDFSYNSAGNFGGAIVNHGGTISTISGTKFSNNTATNGGAIVNTCQFAVIEKIENSEFKYNSAGYFGGAIFIGDDGGYSGNGDSIIGEIKNTTFIGNTTTGGTSSHGAAIYNDSTNDLTLINVVMKENVATGSGGAIFNNQQSVINLRADAGETIIKDNVSFRDTDWNHDIAIWTKGDVNIDAKNNGFVWLDDSIGTENYNQYGLSVNIGSDEQCSDESGVVRLTGTLWNNVNMNLENVTLQLGTNALYNYRGAGDVTTVNFNAISGTVDTTWDNEVKTYEIGRLTSSADVKYQIDVSESGADSFSVASATSGSVVTIDKINLLSGSVDGVFRILTNAADNVVLALSDELKKMFVDGESDVVKAVMDSAMYLGKGIQLATTVTENDSIKIGLLDTFLEWAKFETAEDKVFSLKNDMELNEDVAIVSGTNVTIKGDNEEERRVFDVNSLEFLPKVNYGQNVAIENIKVVNKKGRITNYGTLSLSNVDFSGNKNGQDGAVVINYYDDLKVENSYFSGNGANRYGGVICNTAYGTISLIDGSVFVENTSENGGAIENAGGLTVALIKDTVFEGNSAALGGAIKNGGVIESIQNSVFGNNSANYGGAIYNNGTIGEIKNSVFTGNMAVSSGGAIWSDGDLNIVADAGNTLFSGNYVESAGGNLAEAIRLEGDDITLTLKAINGGEIRFDDYIEGSNYRVNITGDETGVVKIYNDLKKANVSVEKVTFDVADHKIEMDSVVFKNDSTLALKVDSLDEHGQVYAKNSLVVEEGAKLKATLAQGLVDGKPVEVTLLKSDNAFIDNFAESFDNNMYKFNKKDGADGVYQIMLAKTAQEVSMENGGTKENADTAKAWVDESSFGNNIKAQEVANKLAELAQTDAVEFNKALTTIAPTTSPVTSSVDTKVTGNVVELVSKRLDYNYNISNSLGMASGDETSWLMWSQVWMGVADIDNDMELKDKGVLIGLDKQLTRAIKLGVGYSFAEATAKTSDRTREIDVDSHNIFMYGEYQPSKWFVKGYLGYSFTDYEETKFVFGENYMSKYDADTMSVQISTGYDFDLNGVRLSPDVGVRYYHYSVDKYIDGLGQEIKTDLSDKWSLTAGFEVEKMFTTLHNNTFKVEARANVVYDVDESEGSTTVSLANGSTYQINEETVDRFGIEFGADVMYQVRDNLEFGVGYSAEFRSNYTEHTGMLTLKYNF